MKLTPARFKVLLSFILAAFGWFMFSAVWYMLASKYPPQLQGIIMIISALVIAFVGAKILRGSQPMIPTQAIRESKPTRVAIITVILVIIAMLVLPAFILFLTGAR